MTNDPSKDEVQGRPLDKEEAKYLAARIEECSEKLKNAQKEIATEVWGQDRIIALTLNCMVAGGHLLSVGAPGLAKTRLVSRVATVMGLDFRRVQFTPDLMPSDILGSEILEDDDNGKKIIRFNQGPVFTQFMMADEINRAGPRTQSALLEAMQEKRVTVAGHTYTLQRPFHVMATQNPIEQEGTYPLPEAQLDRFLMRLDVDYPDEPAERRVMVETTGSGANIRDLFERSAKGEDLTRTMDKDEETRVRAILGKNDLIIMQKIAKSMPLSDKVVGAVMKIVRNARPLEGSPELIRNNVAWGPGPRAVQAFALAAKARALMEGRLAPGIEDVLSVVDPILEHRMALSFAARSEKVTYKDIKNALIKGL